MQLTVAARSDTGMIRSGNEDSFFADANPARGLFVVADGMGGHAAGEVASEMAVEIVSRELQLVRDLRGDGVAQAVARAVCVSRMSSSFPARGESNASPGDFIP